MSNASSRDTNRAQIFEDEKRRIIDSCFNKRDDDGSSKLRAQASNNPAFSHQKSEIYGQA
jgi:hypothetical protein